MNLWIDDQDDRPPPGWIHVSTVSTAHALLGTRQVIGVSLGDSIGGDPHAGRALVEWMAENRIWPQGQLVVHSTDRLKAAEIRRAIDRSRSG